ncbi:MAG: hypothetical protein R2828_00265 [Saprospiraceae bacterium]
MNRENFSDYLEEPSKLYQLSYQELKSLVLQHPYCANLHLLLLQKSQLDGNPEFSKNLEKTAAHTFDRRFLYELIKSQKYLSVSREDFMAFEEEILELQDINSLEEKVQKIPLVANENDTATILSRETQPPASTSNPSKWEENDETLEETFHFTLDFEVPEEQETGTRGLAEPEKAPPPGPTETMVPPTKVDTPKVAQAPQIFTVSSSLIDALISYSTISSMMLSGFQDPMEKRLEEEESMRLLESLKERMKALQIEVVVPNQPPLPKKNFTSWQKQLSPRRLPTRTEIQLQTPAKPVQNKPAGASKPMKVREIAKRSLADQVEVTSETLAQLLTKQEQYPKAIEMYERLKLKFPQKSVYFAGKIEELIKLM